METFSFYSIKLQKVYFILPVKWITERKSATLYYAYV